MRKLAPIALLLGLACTSATPPPASTESATQAAKPHGLTVAEEARILMLEDRRMYDRELVAEWVNHPNPLHRVRIALALGRIGPHAFIDVDGNNALDPNERRAGVEELVKLTSDSDRSVREMAAFALGEIGDRGGAEALLQLTGGSDYGVAAEAAEALSKLAANPELPKTVLTRYLWLTDEKFPEGVRARALRFLFRFNDDVASAAAVPALGAASEAVRQEAAYTLSRRAYAPARGPLELLLNDTNVLTRAYAATALGRIGQGESLKVLVEALGDVHPWVRTNAAIAIPRVVLNHPQFRSTGHMPRILATADDPDPGVRAAMIEVLGFYAGADPSAVQRLMNTLKNGTLWERELAAGAVAKQFHPAHEQYREIEQGLSPWAIVRVIENSVDKEWGPKVRAQYATHPDPLVRAAVFQTIPDPAVNAERDLIFNALNDPDVVVRANAIDRYALVSTDSAGVWVPALEAAYEKSKSDAMNDARLAAIRSLAVYDRPRRKSFLRELLTDADPVVRRVASDLIVEKLKEPRPAYAPLPATRTQNEYEEIVRWSRTPHTATIHMTRGRIELALLVQDAPMTTWNFAQLAKKKFFDNTSFMRVVPNFVIQGGDPRNDMNGGPGYSIRDEISLQKYTRGAVGMALSGPDTGGSQFFVAHSPQPHLDGGYTIFARVYDGMNSVVDQTERGDRVQTIAIDERPPASATQVSSVPNVSLPLIIGEITPDRLVTTVPVYASKRDEYKPDTTVVEMMKDHVQAGDRVEVFMGTWCDDSQREVPKFLRIADELKSQYGVELPARFVAVDKSKQQPAALLTGKSLQKVATFIYYRGDRELGRIEERPQGLFEDDLLTIVAKQ
ncbi:MAG TPA: HEAT repeat domain-containing protein [Thermoanaerobaculia bacterium]|nr:HEAT repeat domain-containing protein [Thermoanaerobaculia bacterium]